MNTANLFILVLAAVLLNGCGHYGMGPQYHYSRYNQMQAVHGYHNIPGNSMLTPDPYVR